MRYKKLTGFYLLSLMVLFSGSAMAQEKLAQTGFQFLSVSQGARASALGGAYTTVEGSPNTLFYNPAGIARISSTFSVSINYFNWIAGIQHASGAVTYTPSNGNYGVFGLSVQNVDYGKLEGTMVWPNEQGFVETGDFYPHAIAIGLAYGRALTNKFVVGGQIKLVGQQLGQSSLPNGVTKRNVANAVAFDFGTIYKTGFKSLVFGMSVRNFSQEIKYEEEGFQLPLTFKIGISMDAADYFMPDQDTHHLFVSIDAAHPRSHPEYLNLGLEYKFMNAFALRLGYVNNQDEYNYSLGFGFQQFGLSLDYAYVPFGVFGGINRFTFMYQL